MRFPNVRVAYSEAQIGWMPYVVEQADRIWAKPTKVTGLVPSTIPPSERFRDRVFGCVFEDDFGITIRDVVGVNQITFESDYPHQDSTWPHTHDYAKRVLGHLSHSEIDKIVRRNAIDLFGLSVNLPLR